MDLYLHRKLHTKQIMPTDVGKCINGEWIDFDFKEWPITSGSEVQRAFSLNEPQQLDRGLVDGGSRQFLNRHLAER